MGTAFFRNVALFLTVIAFGGVSSARSKEKSAPESPVRTAAQNAPAWATDAGRLKAFPQSEYISALGTGFSESQAKERAASHIASFIRTQVTSQTHSRYSQSETDNVASESKSVEEEIALYSSQEVYTMDFTAPWLNDMTGEYFCVAFIDRAECWKILKARLDTIMGRVEGKIASAASDNTGFWRQIYLSGVRDERDEFYALYDFALLVNNDGAQNYREIERAVLSCESEVKKQKSAQTVRLAVAGDKNGIVYRALAHSFEKNGFSVGGAAGKFKADAVVTAAVRQEKDVFVCYPGISLEVKNAAGVQVASFSDTAKKTVGFEKSALEEKAYRALCDSAEDLLK